MTETFTFTAKAKRVSVILMLIGLVGLILGFIFFRDDSTRVWANILLNGYYFMGISLAAIFFVAAHQVGYSGWHTLIKRIPEAMGGFVPVAGIVILIILLGTVFHWHHLYHWTDTFAQKEEVTMGDLRAYEADIIAEQAAAAEHGAAHDTHSGHGETHAEASMEEEHTLSHHVEIYSQMDDYKGLADDATIINPHFDKILKGKNGFLNIPFFSFRVIAYLVLWILLSYMLRRISIKEDELGGLAPYKQGKFFAALFLVVFAVTSSTASWDFIMSINTHWYSTLFGWYNFASYLVAGISAIALFVIFLKYNGYLKIVNNGHLHDLGRYMFGFSIFWTYLWFCQFLLIWYGNIPEATAYYAQRFDSTFFKVIFFSLFIINFVFPFLVLMTRNSKRNVEVIVLVAIVLIFGHWLDYYLMIMPGSVGAEHAGIGLLELSVFTGFIGMFIYIVLATLTKSSLIPVNNPYLKESIQHHT